MDWLAEDPPTWQWAHDPEYRSLRALAIIRRYNEVWAQFYAASDARRAA